MLGLTVAPGITVSVWLARGIGPVKVETDGAGTGQVLKSFKPGK